MKTLRRLIWSSAAQSHVGMVRTVNEDACLDLSAQGLWAVADGMGGHEAGDVASRMIADTLAQVPLPSTLDDFIATVKGHLIQVNRQLRNRSIKCYHNRIIGSTVVALLTHCNQGACLWVGDSRAYRLRNANLQQLTRDHSHVQSLVDRGLLDPAEAPHHPMGNVITRAVGSADQLDIDAVTFQLENQDIFLLCSDGLNKALSEEEIATRLAKGDTNDAVRALMHTALARGANDNVTVVVVRIGEAGAHDAPGVG